MKLIPGGDLPDFLRIVVEDAANMLGIYDEHVTTLDIDLPSYFEVALVSEADVDRRSI